MSVVAIPILHIALSLLSEADARSASVDTGVVIVMLAKSEVKLTEKLEALSPVAGTVVMV